MEFPYGKAPLCILILAILAGSYFLFVGVTKPKRPDLILVTFAKDHVPGHRQAAEAFEKLTGKRVEIQLVDSNALYRRLLAAMQSGAAQPDLVELLEGSLGQFSRGPLEDVGFVDLTDRVKAEGWEEKLVASRFSLWSSRGRIFGIPHDVHPVMLAYRRDIVEKLGIDVSTLTTWDEFARVGREVVTKDLNGDGVPDRFMIDLDSGGGSPVQILMLQRGLQVLDERGAVKFDDPEVADLLEWYIRQVSINSPDRIAFSAGWGQTLSRAMIDGLVLFYFCPDWRTKGFQQDVQAVSGKMALMPLPAWKKDGLRTSTWGGTGLAITKACKDPDLAWEFAKFVYYKEEFLPERYLSNNILPPLKSSWDMPVMAEKDPFFSNQQRGLEFARLAPSTPAKYLTAFQTLADSKLNEAFVNSLAHYNSNGDKNLKAFIQSELDRTAAQVRQQIDRNQFFKVPAEGSTSDTSSDGEGR
jgi:arabinosaccharide transport system substrate-binding protein